MMLTMLFDQALILEGRTPVNLNEFANRMTRLMQRVFQPKACDAGGYQLY